MEKPMCTDCGLEVEFEGIAQIWRTDRGSGHASSGINIGHEPRARSEVVPQVRRHAQQPVARRCKLCSPKEFSTKFPIAAVEVVPANGVPQHMAVGKTQESQIMGLHPAKHRDALSCADPDAKILN